MNSASLASTSFLYDFLRGCIRLPEKIERVVSLYPSITEILVSIGFLANIVGVSSWCKLFVKEVRKIPSVASATAVNYERLKSLNPDIVLVSTGFQQKLAAELYQQGFNVYPVMLPKSLYGIIENVMVVGSLIGRREEAGKLVEELLEELKTYSVKVSCEERPKVYVEFWPESYSITAGRLTFVDDLIYSAGGLNLFSKAAGFFKPDFNEVSRGNPDIMIFIFERKADAEMGIEPLIARRGWSHIKAVKEGRILVSTEKELPLTHSGPSFTLTLKLLSEKFKELKLIDRSN